ncbi:MULTISPECIES: ectoine/hydroxyectoine ABC transporter permease subunit EhuC [unclassified Mesorhizobium]|uniref:ectoine/hydroxyectoine ABC transporter permease subunit EhuC n=1 Tax=unclassified Mesorhizobium TaxID=325217 RepID=UPI00333D0A06
MSLLDFFIQYSPQLFSGAYITVLVFACSSMLSIALAISAGLSKMAQIAPLRWVANIYVELFRGTSLLVQLYWIFFVLPLFGLTIEKFTAGCLAIGLNIGAYGAELVRGAILAVPKGQTEAAIALNMTTSTRIRRIILPQAFLIALPAWGNLQIELLKATALVALISVGDLMFEVRQINGVTYLSAQAFGAALIIYYVLARFLLTPAMRVLEMGMRRKLGGA